MPRQSDQLVSIAVDIRGPPEGFAPWMLPGLWLVTFAVYLAGLGDVPLWDRDEPRYAQATLQMMKRGDYLVPYYLTYDNSGDPARPDPRFHKPPIVYWSQVVACRVFGEGEFAVRLPSAVYGATAAVLLAMLGQMLINPATGFWAAVICAAAPLTQVMCKICLCDAPLLVAVVTALLLLSRQMRLGASRTAGWAMWGALGFGLLAKGPVVLLFYLGPVLALAIGGGHAIRARLGEALCPLTLKGSVLLPWPVRGAIRGLAGPLVMLGVAATWVVPVQLATRDFRTPPTPEFPEGRNSSFLAVSMGTHVLHRAVTPMEGHKGLPGYYVGLVLLTFFPWSLLLPMAMWRGLRRQEKPESDKFGDSADVRADQSVAPVTAEGSSVFRLPPGLGLDDRPEWSRLFLLGWAVIPWVVLEFHATKLPHYFLPTVPALALLVARYLMTVGAVPNVWRRGWLAVVIWSVPTLLTGASLAGLLTLSVVSQEWNLPALLPFDPEGKAGQRFAEGWRIFAQVEPAAVTGMAVVAAVVTALSVWGAASFRNSDVPAGITAWAATLAAGGVLLSTLVVPELTPLQVSKRTADWIAEAAPTGEVILLGIEGDPLQANYDQDSLVFYLRGRARRAKTWDDLVAMLRTNRGRGQPCVVVADLRYWSELQQRWPELPRPAMLFEGINYVKGRTVRLGIAVLRSAAP